MAPTLPLPKHMSIAEGEYVPAIIETARIVNVNIDDWSVDAVSEHGNKRWFDIQVMSPYFHFVNGEGVFYIPEVGALVWICTPSSGRFASAFVLGYQAPFEDESVGFRNGRPSYNPGDIVHRTRDENFVVLRRGGVVQIGSTPITQRMYIPIRNFIKDFCENYELHTFGGDMLWLTDRDDQTTEGSAPTTFHLKAKEKADDPNPIATLSIGSHGEDSNTTLELTIFENGAEGTQAAKMLLTLGKDGNSVWSLEGAFALSAAADVSISSREGNVSVESESGQVSMTSKADMSFTSSSNHTLTVKGRSTDKAGVKTLDASIVKLGSPNAVEPAIKGTQLLSFLTLLIGQVSAIAQTSPPGAPTTAATVSGLAGQLSNLISTKVFVE